MSIQKIFEKHIKEIKNVRMCGADVVMDSVWATVLINFYNEIHEEMEKLKTKK